MLTSAYPWIGFHILIFALLFLDLKLFQRRPHEIKMREALFWSGCWISLALLFNLYIYFDRGGEAALQFFTGYLIEKSLSIDNLFVFLLIFSYFKTPKIQQHRVLYWGIIGALAMRILFILGGIALIHHFSWTLYLFGAFLCFTAVRFFFQKRTVEPQKNFLIQIYKRFFPVTHEGDGHFFVRKKRMLYATPLFLVLLTIESSDILFATDSIPAVFAITTDPFLVYTSNIFAILGLRSLYFVLAQFMGRFIYLKQGLALILFFIGLKMLIAPWYKMPIQLALGALVLILLISVLASLLRKKKD